MSCGFLCFHLCGSGAPVTTTCHCCAVVFLQSRRMRRSLHTLRCVRPLRLMAQPALAPLAGGEAPAAGGRGCLCLSAAALRPVLRRRTFRGYIHDHIPFQSSRGEMYQPQNFLPQASKTFASAPGHPLTVSGSKFRLLRETGLLYRS